MLYNIILTVQLKSVPLLIVRRQPIKNNERNSKKKQPSWPYKTLCPKNIGKLYKNMGNIKNIEK